MTENLASENFFPSLAGGGQQETAAQE